MTRPDATMSSSTQLLSSVEVRWFLEGPVPTQVATWFKEGEKLDWGGVRSRTDTYLQIPGGLDMGIKAREGKCEVKGRLAQSAVLRFTETAAGTVERWMKWSYAEPAGAWLENLDVATPGLVHVDKQRASQMFCLARGRDEEIGSDDHAAPGYSLELTSLTFRNSPFWTIGFEAFPADEVSDSTFVELVSRRLRGFPVHLPSARCHSYPQWLFRS